MTGVRFRPNRLWARWPRAGVPSHHRPQAHETKLRCPSREHLALVSVSCHITELNRAAPYIPEASFRQRTARNQSQVCTRSQDSSFYLLVSLAKTPTSLLPSNWARTAWIVMMRCAREQARLARVSMGLGGLGGHSPANARTKRKQGSRYNGARGVSSVSNIDAQLTMLSSGASDTEVGVKGRGSRWGPELEVWTNLGSWRVPVVAESGINPADPVFTSY